MIATVTSFKAQLHIALIVNGSNVREFVSFEPNFSSVVLVTVFEQSHYFRIGWASIFVD